MRTQLALMKNTIAFALYIDETLAVDLTDPQTTQMLVRPVVCLPSGVSYSATTYAQLEAEARLENRRPICPQSGLPIHGTIENKALDSILSRYMFKQQITKDVVSSLREFQSAPLTRQPAKLFNRFAHSAGPYCRTVVG